METINRRFNMSEKLGKARSFRQWTKNQERLEKVEELGLNVSELVNQAIARSWADVLRDALKAQKDRAEKALKSLSLV